MAEQFSVRFRPTRLEDMVVGNREILDLAAAMSKKAQAILITGQSGSGKTTTARILNRMINGENYKTTLIERNCAGDSGKSAIAEVQSFVNYKPNGAKHVVVLDEVHGLSPQAMEALLKLIEDLPHSKILFVLCTNQPYKLKSTLVDRCRQINLLPPSVKDLALFVLRIMKRLKLDLDIKDQKILAVKIAKASGCIPRAAMQALENAVDLIAAGKSVEIVESVIARGEDGNIDRMVGTTFIAIYSALKVKEDASDAAAAILELMPVDAMGYLMRLQSANYYGMQMMNGGKFNWQAKVLIEALKAKKLQPSLGTMLRVSQQLNSIRESMREMVTDPTVLIGTGVASICFGESK